MTNSFQWASNGKTVFGPVSEINDKGSNGILLPTGPLESGPFDKGEVWVGISKADGKFKVPIRWSDDVDRVPDVAIRWNIVDPAKKVPFLWEKVELGVAMADPMQWSAERESDHLNVLNRHVAAGSVFSLTVICPSMTARAVKLRSASVNSIMYQMMTSVPDVHFSFPASNSGFSINSAILVTHLPFFKRFFPNVESMDLDAPHHPRQQGAGAANPTQAAFVIRPTPAGQEIAKPANLNGLNLTVDNTDGDSFASAILFSLTGHINFASAPAPQPQAPDSGSDSPRRARGNNSQPVHWQPPAPAPQPAPAPTSPVANWKAVCLIHHQLGLPQLKENVLAAFKDSLTLDNVVGELFGPLSQAYTDVRGVAMEYAIKHRDSLRERDDMKAKIQASNPASNPAEAEIVMDYLRKSFFGH